jgi:hypothetical protein
MGFRIVLSIGDILLMCSLYIFGALDQSPGSDVYLLNTEKITKHIAIGQATPTIIDMSVS